MEIFAFHENAVGYEDQGPEAQLRSFDDINLDLPKSAIMGVAGVAAATAVMSATPNAQAVVGPGDVCPEVGSVQSALNSRGFNAGVPDNNFGIQTTNAVRSFQAFNGLSVDGVVGPATADALGLGDVENPNSPFLVGNSCVGGGTGQEISATVTASSGLIVRTAPGTFNAQAGSLPFGATVLYDPGSRTNASGFTWVRITSGSFAGRWVAEDFLGTGGSGGGQEVSASVTAGSGLIVRTAPGTFNAQAGSLPFGATVFYDPGSRTNASGFTWVRITSGSFAGRWVAEDFLGTGGSGGGQEVSASVTAGSGLIVRTAPGTFNAQAGSLPFGATVFYDPGSSTAASGLTWVRITSGTYAGRWVARDFLSF